MRLQLLKSEFVCPNGGATFKKKKMGFTQCKAEQPLRGMELKEIGIQEICSERRGNKLYVYTLIRLYYTLRKKNPRMNNPQPPFPFPFPFLFPTLQLSDTSLTKDFIK